MLALELTERTLAESRNNTQDIINKLNAYGIKLYLDDFGIGYSNLAAIADLPLNRLKMDKGLVDRIKANQDNILIKKTIELAKLFHLDVVAEEMCIRDRNREGSVNNEPVCLAIV